MLYPCEPHSVSSAMSPVYTNLFATSPNPSTYSPYLLHHPNSFLYSLTSVCPPTSSLCSLYLHYSLYHRHYLFHCLLSILYHCNISIYVAIVFYYLHLFFFLFFS